mmetsp:Transcript_61054/g.145455  ORF Transcript_61054/g.145455 Transcript_61054/m.145455 type:complete len:212 (+) Transcript_61054:257-892(+)
MRPLADAEHDQRLAAVLEHGPGVWAEVHGGCGGPERESAAEAPGAQLRLEGRENLHQPLALGKALPGVAGQHRVLGQQTTQGDELHPVVHVKAQHLHVHKAQIPKTKGRIDVRHITLILQQHIAPRIFSGGHPYKHHGHHCQEHHHADRHRPFHGDSIINSFHQVSDQCHSGRPCHGRRPAPGRPEDTQDQIQQHKKKQLLELALGDQVAT